MNSVKSDLPATSVDLETVEPLNPKRTLAFINHWIIQMVAFLNKFASVCEDKLSEVDAKLQRTEDTLAILEAKLASIPELQNITANPAVVEQPAEISQDGATPPAIQNGAAQQAVEDANEGMDTKAAPNPDVVPISKVPEYATFFKMVAVGVPVAAVKLKMTAEGLDPDLLDDPDAPAPPGAKLEDAETLSDSADDLSSWSD